MKTVDFCDKTLELNGVLNNQPLIYSTTSQSARTQITSLAKQIKKALGPNLSKTVQITTPLLNMYSTTASIKMMVDSFVVVMIVFFVGLSGIVMYSLMLADVGA